MERNVPLFVPLCPELLFSPLVDLNGPPCRRNMRMRQDVACRSLRATAPDGHGPNPAVSKDDPQSSSFSFTCSTASSRLLALTRLDGARLGGRSFVLRNSFAMVGVGIG